MTNRIVLHPDQKPHTALLSLCKLPVQVVSLIEDDHLSGYNFNSYRNLGSCTRASVMRTNFFTPPKASIIVCTLMPPFRRDPSSGFRPTPRSISLKSWMVVLSMTFRLRMLKPFNRLSEINLWYSFKSS